MFFSIESGAFPQVALSPRQLILPLFRHECMVLENGNAFSGFTISSFLKERKGYSATFSFKEASYLPNPLQIQFNVDDTWNTSAFYSGKADRHFELKKRESNSRQMVGIEYPKDLLLCGEAHLTIYDSEKKFCAESCWNFTSWGGQYFAEVRYPRPTDIAEPTSLDISRGFQIFKRDEPGFISIASRPAPSETCHEIRGETSPGLVSCEFFGFFPLKDMKPNVSLGSLEGPSEIPVENVKLMTVRMWPQQCAKRGTGMFAFTPELMLTEDFSDWVKDIPYQYCIRVSVPKDCSSGIYTAPVLIDGITCAKYKLIVDDFILPEYNDMTFGLYADGKRWIKQNFTDDEILREMHEFREHGINALMLYPLSGSLISYENGTYHVDCSKFRHIMQLYKQVGFPGVAVLSLQGLDSRLSKALDEQITMLSPTFEEGLESVLKTLKTMGEKDGWPDFCIHVIDEPNFKKREKEAIASLKIVKNAGFKTFNTCYPEFVRKMLAPWLDYRCYNNIGYHTSSTQEKNESIRQETLEDGDAFWWYGAGCYVSKGGCQDGNIYSNRHMLGIFNWKSSASGAWSWTFLRCFGNPYNDFDDSIKEQCICYPAFEGHGTIDTLQWEAIREGVYDYRYIRYWDELCKNNIDKPAKRRVVSHSRRRISKTMDSINWNSLNYSVSNTQLRNLRQELIQEIKLLHSLVD